jgi:hypothetical protein
MKSRAWRGVFGVCIAAAGLLALSATAATPVTEKAKSPTAKPADAAKKEEPMGTVEGIEVKYGDGYFGVALAGSNFQIKFYDKKRHVIPTPFKRAVLHWPVSYKPIDERTVLNAAEDGKSLGSAKIVKPPYFFKLYITFLAEGADESSGSETFVIDFRN